MITILIAEDDALTRIGLLSVISWEEHGYTVVGAAEHGQQALGMALELKPDIVITDIKMPVLDGIQLMSALQKELPETKFIVLSAYNDFDYVREALKMGAVDYLLKLDINPELLLGTLNKASHSLQSKTQILNIHADDEECRKTLKQMLVGEWNQETDLFNKLRTPFAVPEKNLVLVLCVEETFNEVSKQNLYYPEISSIKTNLGNLMVEYGTSCCCVIRNRLYVSLLSLKDSFVALQFRATKERIEQKIQEHYFLGHKIRFKVVFSKIMQHFSEVSETYQAMQEDFVFTHSQKGNEISAYYQKLILDICEAIRQRSEELLKKAFKSIYAIVSTSKDFNTEFFKNILTALIYEISLTFQELDVYGSHLLGLEVINKQKEICFEADDFEECLRQIEVLCISIVMNTTTAISDNVASIVKRTLEKEYANQNLTLSIVAQLVNISESYLCRIFKMEFGLTPIQYLTQVRIINAKRYLKITNLQMQEISARVGYANPFYFTRIFKRVVGLTPTAYRQANRTSL